MPRLLEDFRRHIARCSTCGCEDVKSFLVHYPREAEIGDEEISIIFWGSEEQVFRFEVPMDDAVIVEVSYRGEGGSDQVCGVGLVVAAFSTYSIKEFSAEGEVGY